MNARHYVGVQRHAMSHLHIFALKLLELAARAVQLGSYHIMLPLLLSMPAYRAQQLIRS